MARDSGTHTFTVRLAAQLVADAATRPETSDPEHPQCWPVWQVLAPLPLTVLAATRALPGTPRNALAPAVETAATATRYLGAAGFFPRAYEQVKHVAAGYTRLLGPHHPKTIEARCNEARWLGELGTQPPRAGSSRNWLMRPRRYTAPTP